MLVPRNAGFGDVASAPVVEQPVGSFGDQYNTCVAAGGDPASCALALVGGGSGSVGPTLSSLSTTAATMLSTPITIGQSSVPVWAIGTLLLSIAWIVTSAASGASRVTKRVTGRARKIRKGFTA